MNALAPTHKAGQTQIRLESLAADKTISDPQKVAEVSKQFEAVLLRQIMSDIRKPVLDKAQGDATVNGIYNDMINNQMADSVEKGGGLGLATSLSAQLSHQVLSKSQSESPSFTHPVPVQKSTVCNP